MAHFVIQGKYKKYMKAAQINKYGSSDVIEIVDIEKPKAGPGQVLIKAYASSVNPVDIKIMEGYMSNIAPLKFPATLGSDVAGVVTEVGEGVTEFAVGNKIYGQAIVLAGASGAFAEFVAVPAGMIAKMPKNINFNQAAASVLVGVSVVQALLEHFKLRSGQKILIHGGAGGIGTMAIQIAKSIGAFVATTATGDGIEYVKKLGADQVIDYRNEKFDEIVSDFDAVFDTVGGEVFEKSFKVLKKGRVARDSHAVGSPDLGIIVSMVAQDNKKLADQYGVTAISQWTKVTTEHLNMLTDFIENKGLKIFIDKIYTLDTIKEALEAKEKGYVKGKIVIQIN